MKNQKIIAEKSSTVEIKAYDGKMNVYVTAGEGGGVIINTPGIGIGVVPIASKIGGDVPENTAYVITTYKKKGNRPENVPVADSEIFVDNDGNFIIQ